MMRNSKSIIAVLALFSGLGISSAVEGRTQAGILAVQPERTYIVKLDENNGNLNQLSSLVDNALGRQVEFTSTYTHALTGGAVTITAAEAQVLQNVDGLSVSADFSYSEPTYTTDTDRSVNPAEQPNSNFTQETIHVDYENDATHMGSGIKIGILDTGLFYDQIASSADSTGYQAFRPLTADDMVEGLSLTESDVAAAAATDGFHGASGKYVNSKIIFEYDYADSDNNVQPKTGSEHGTHVASLAAGNGAQYTGMAPNAQLAIMKVFSDYGGGATSESVLSAMDDAVVLGLDVINLSLGTVFVDAPGYNSYDQSIEYQIIQDLQNSGTLVNFAAGNDGRSELSGVYANYVSADVVETGELGSYALLDSGNVVASSTLDKAYRYFWNIDDDTSYELEPTDQVSNHTFSSLVSESGDTLEYQVVGVPTESHGTAEDFSKVDVSGKVAIIWRGGGVTFESMAKQAEAAGCAALMVVNNTTEQLSMSFGSYSPTIPIVMITQAAGNRFTEENQSGVLVYRSNLEDNSLVGTMSEFSSDGLTSDMRLKPDITAPGTGIVGAVKGGYQEMSGTSMATPNYTGAMALLMGEHAGSAEELAEYKNELMARAMSTTDLLRDTASNDGLDQANGVKSVNAEGEYLDAQGNVVSSSSEAADVVDYNYASPKNQGAGQIDVHKALTSQVWLDTGYTDGEDGSLTGDSHSAQLTNKISFGTSFNAQEEAMDFTDHVIHTHNEGNSAITYNAKMYVALPEMQIPLSSDVWNNFTDEGKEIYGHGYTTTYLKSNLMYQVAEIDLGDYTINPGDGTITLPTVDLSADSTNPAASIIANYVEMYYDQGTTLEGYITFTPEGTTYTSSQLQVEGQLSVPYIAYYGDYGAADATEPFDFEKESVGEIYTSDLVNGFAKSYVGYENAYADFGSHIYGISGLSASSSSSLDEIAMNVLAQSWIGISPVSAYGGFKLGFNSEFGAYSSGVVAGVTGVSDQLLIQEFVQRDMISATVDLIQLPTSDAAEPTVISTSTLHSYPNMDNIDDDSSGVFGDHLFRSLPTQSALESGYYVNMAGGIVELKDSQGNQLPEGEYELRFNYTLMATDDETGEHFTQTKTVPVTIDRSPAELVSVVNDGFGGTLYASEAAEYITFQTEQTTTVRFYSDESTGQKYVYLTDSYAYNGLIRATIHNSNGLTQDILIDNRGENPLVVIGSTDNVALLSYSRTATDTDVTYTINALSSTGSMASSFYLNSHSFQIYIESGLDENTTFYTVNAMGQKVELDPSQYSYDAETGLIILTDLGSGITGFGYSL